MKVSSGVRLGQYEVLSPAGAGGMGEVWKARDTRLRRQVAIKTLPNALSANPERLARLEREAEILASLNHPNIAVIHGLEEDDGTRFLVLEFVEGETVDERLRPGALSVKDALDTALQIAWALEAAHERGVVHRDLKPANVMVTPEGRVKVLDFGIAKPHGSESGDALTRTAIATQPGIVIGSPEYMSPEQARGEPTGPQTDIWSFGVVLYECLTGASPFKEKTASGTLAKVLETAPDYTKLPPNLPASVVHLIQRCLEKDRKRRVHHIGDVRIEIEEALAALDSPPLPQAEAPAPRWTLVVGVVALCTVAGLIGWFGGRRSASAPPAGSVRLSIPFGEPVRSLPFGNRHLAISADGTRVAYSARNRLLVRWLNAKDPVAVSDAASSPVFSPDAKWVAGLGESGLIKVPADGGTPVMLAKTAARPAGVAWGDDGTIVFGTTEGLFQISQDGGAPRLLLKPDRGRKERLYAWPELLPGGRSLLFTIVQEGSPAECQIALLNLKTLERKTIVKGSSPHFVRSGHLVYAAGPTLKAVVFDRDRGEMMGDPVALAEIEVGTAPDNGAADFALSESGTLVFISASTVGGALRTLEWRDRAGQRQAIAVQPDAYGYPRVSPDGTQVALDINRSGYRDIWILNLQRLILTQLTDGPTEDMLPVWSRDSRRVYFDSDRAGTFDIYSQPADGATGPRVEYSGPGMQLTESISPDGRQLLVYEDYKDISLLNLDSPGLLTPLFHGTAADLRLARVSPDGHWIAYESNEAGAQYEVFVRPFPQVGDRRDKISIDGGRFPNWGPPGSHELYYVSPSGDMMAASVTTMPTLKIGAVTKLFEYQKPPANRSGMPYDVAPDGRFLMVRAVASDSPAPIVTVILNWSENFRTQTSHR